VAAAWINLPAWAKGVLILLAVAPLGWWGWWSPGTLFAAGLGAFMLAGLVRKGGLRGREARVFLGIMIVALALRFGAGSLHYQYARSIGVGADYFPDASMYSARGQYIAEALWGEEWPIVDDSNWASQDPDGTVVVHHGYLQRLRKLHSGALPPSRTSGLRFFSYFVGVVYTIFGYSPVAVKWLMSLGGTLLVGLVYLFLRKEGWGLAAPVALVLVAFYPSLFLWSVTGLRDSWTFTLCLVLLGVYVLGDWTRRASLTTAAAGYLVFGAWVMAIAGVLLIVGKSINVTRGLDRYLLSYFTSGKRNHHRVEAARGQAFEAEQFRSSDGVEQPMDEGNPGKESGAFGVQLLFFGAVGIVLLSELRLIVAFLLCFVYILSFLFQTIALAFSGRQGWLRFFRMPKFRGPALIVFVIVGGGWLGSQAFWKKHDPVRAIVGAQIARTQSSKAPIFIYPSRFYPPNDRDSVNKEIKKGLTLSEFLSALSVGLVYNLFAPFPSGQGAWTHKAASAQMVLLYGLYLFAAVGAGVAYRRTGWRYWPLWLFLALFLFVNALAQGNVGIIFRHRDQITPIIIAAAAVGIVEVLQWVSQVTGKRIVVLPSSLASSLGWVDAGVPPEGRLGPGEAPPSASLSEAQRKG